MAFHRPPSVIIPSEKMRLSPPRLPGHTRRGSTLIEFVLAGSFIFVPILLGLSTVGMSLLMSERIVALNRNATHMFATGMDFSQAAKVNLMLTTAGTLNITPAGGEGVIILSEIQGTGNNNAVCVRQFVIGNAALRQSSYVNPSAGIVSASGGVTNLSDPSANANSFNSMLPLAQGQTAYLGETYFSTAQFDWTGFLKGTGIYEKVVF